MTDRRLILFATLLGAAFHGFLGVWLGQDFNYDRLNYHDYLGWKLFSGLPFDWNLPANYLQAWLNPLPYAPHHLLHALLPAWWAQLALGMIQGSLGGLIAAIALKMLKPDAPYRRWLALGAVVVGLTGPMLVSEAGTSFVDGLLGLFVLGGLWFVVGREPRPRDAFFAALLIGLGFGLKSTGAIYAVGLAAGLLVSRLDVPLKVMFWNLGPMLAALVVAPIQTAFLVLLLGVSEIWALCLSLVSMPIVAALFYWRYGSTHGLWLNRLLAAALGGLSGWLVTGGWHAYRLWSSFGNPIWPYFDVGGAGDTRFIPESLVEGLLYPWLIAIGEGPTSEIRFADPRWLLIIGVAIIFAMLWRRKTAGMEATWLRHPGDVQLMLAFFAGVWLPWLALFGLERFIAPLEALSGLVLLALIASLRLPQRQALFWLAVLVFMMPALSRTPDLMRQDWSIDGYRAELATIPQNATIILAPGRYAYLIPLLPKGTQIIGLNYHYRDAPAILTKSANTYFLSESEAPSGSNQRILQRFWQSPNGVCRPVTTRFDRLFLCGLSHDEDGLAKDIGPFGIGKDGVVQVDIEAFRRGPERANYIVPLYLLHSVSGHLRASEGVIAVTYPRESCPTDVRFDLHINGRRILTGLPPDKPTVFKLPNFGVFPMEMTMSVVDRTQGDRHRFDRKPCTGIRVTSLILQNRR